MTTESHESVDAVHVAGFQEAIKHGPGAFYFSKNHSHLLFVSPGLIIVSSVCITRGDDMVNANNMPLWKWDGNTEKPTLSPSLHLSGTWHGFLRSGRFESC